MLKVLTLCSGIEAVIQGYENLFVPHMHVAACETDKKVRAVLQHNFDAQRLFDDICELHPSDVPDHDMMWAGFPCQPWSTCGRGQGLDDEQGRGIIILHIIRLMYVCLPKIVVLENVGGMASKTHKDFFEAVLVLLTEIKVRGLHYEVQWQLLDSKYFGIPQSRPRIWIICRRSDVAERKLRWPRSHSVPCGDIDRLLGPRPPRAQVEQSLPRTPSARINAIRSLDSLRAKGIDPFNETWIMEVSQSSGRRGSMMKGCSPCLTKTRASNGGHWISTHGRFMEVGEMLELQHMRRDRINLPEGVTTRDFGGMIGNSMTVAIVEVILAMLSRACPGVFPGELPDRWSS